MRALTTIAGVVALAGACGGDGDGDRLVEDPAVETGCTTRPGPGVTRAKRVTCADELLAGALASGRTGDFLLANEKVSVIVRGPGPGYYLHGSSGGGIVDAAPHGGEDLIKEVLPSIDLAVGAFDELVITEAGDDGPAELVVRGPATSLDLLKAALGREPPAVIIEHRYRLAAGADAVELETRVTPAEGSEPATHEVFEAMFVGGRAPAFVPGVGWPESSVVGSQVATGGTTTSYALVAPAGGTLQLIDIGGIRVVRVAAIGSAPVTRWLAIGDGSVADATAKGWAVAGVPTGVVRGTTAPGVDVAVRSGDKLVTVARADASGAFTARVPAGAYTLRAEAVGRLPGDDVAVTVDAGGDVTRAVPAGAGGHVEVTVRDEAGTLLPARVRLEQAGREGRLAWTDATGKVTVPLEPGTWQATVSRGLEYDVHVAGAVTVEDGATATVTATLERVLDTGGWISLDTHLHSEVSTDSTFPLDQRVRAVAGEGVEIPVSSDHDFVIDYTPVIRAAGLEGWLATLPGSETSSLVFGHVNGFPMTPRADRSAGGSPSWLGVTPGKLFDTLRGSDGALVQVNHPRKDSNNLFDAIGFDRDTLGALRNPVELGFPPGTDLSDLDFDAVEVANASEADDFEEVFADWLALVAGGHRSAATGSSDSHGPGAYAGESRTYVWVGPTRDTPATTDPTVVTGALRRRRAVVAGGAFVTAGVVSGATVSLPGDTVDVGGQPMVTLDVRVQAPPWQPLQEVRLYQGRQLVRTIALDPADTRALRFAERLELPAPAADTFYVVRVDPAGPGSPVLGTTLPSFTNPVFVTVGP